MSGRFNKAHKNSLYMYTVEFKEVKKEKRGRGNPGINPKPPVIEIKWTITIQTTGENEALMAKFKHKEECFALITNVENHKCDMRQILGYYKDQMVVEIEFRLLKEPCIASIIYLKTPERIRALMMLLSVSLLIRALIQYKMRKGIKEYEGDLPNVGWNGAKLQHNLTMNFLTVAMYGQYFTREKANSYSYVFSNGYTQLQVTTILKLMDMSVESLLE